MANLRDDLPDAGSAHISATIQELKRAKPELLVECLSPDFAGDTACVETVNIYVKNYQEFKTKKIFANVFLVYG